MKSAAPRYLAAHAAHLPTLPGWGADGDRPAVTVYEGARPDRGDVRRWVTLGYIGGDAGPAVHLEPVPGAQSQAQEAGTIGCSLVVAAADVPTARGAVFGLVESWAAWLAADATLQQATGQAQLLSDSTARLIVDVALTTTRAGATASALVVITYTATTYG